MGMRYVNRRTVHVLKNYYKSSLEKRNLKSLEIYKTAVLKYPSSEEATKLNLIRHIWGTGDRYYKLANKHYGDSELWWVIAFFNQKPTESHVNLGDTVFVPLNLDLMLEVLGI